jgi:putative ABC transport system permease protein
VTEIRLAIRRLMSRRATMTVSVGTLGMAIGAGAATWSMLSAVLLNPLPVRDAERLATVGALLNAGAQGPVQTGLFCPYYPHVAASGIFESTAAIWLTPLPLPVGAQKAAQTTPVMFVSETYFDVLGLTLALGRVFSTDENRRGLGPVAILSDQYWRAAFGANPDVIGESVRVGEKLATIIGVAPRGFRGLSLAQDPAMFLPLETIADVGPPTTNYFADPQHTSSPTAGLGIIGRVRAGQTFEEARARLATVGPLPGRGDQVSWHVTDIQTAAIPAIAREGTSRFARLLTTTVGLLVLIGCSTVGLLLLVRTEARREEFATCLALGATRAQLARGVVIEGAILTSLAACLSPLVASWLFSAVSTFQLPGGIALGLLDLSLDRRALAIILALAAGTTLLIAAVAAVFGFRADVADSLRARSGATPRMARRGTRAVLLTIQVAIALTLVAGTGLFARSLMGALDLNRRIDSARIVDIAQVPLAQDGYSAARAATFFGGLQEQLRGNPFLAGVATSASQGGMGPGGTLTIDGVSRTFPAFVAFRHVDDNYFSTMRMRILRGRHFSPGDVAGAPLVGTVSESFGRMIGSGSEVLGRHIVTMFGGRLDIEIVGVVDDLFTDIRDPEPLALYMPMAQRTQPTVNRALVFRAANDVDAARRELVAVVRQLDPNLQLPAGVTLDDRLLRQMAPQQFGLLVLGSLGAIALLLTVLGTYVLAETMAVMRTRELGIRAALGATSRSLTILVLRESVVLVGLGLCAGLLLSYLGANVIRAFLFRVHPLDPTTLGAVAALILLLTTAVSMRPALRAARVDLAEVLRSE